MDKTAVALTLRRVLLSGVLGLALLIPASVIPGPGAAATCAAASGDRVAVVVQHQNGATVSDCVSFSGSSITGEQALVKSDIGSGILPSGGFGVAVCQLDGEPATYPPSCWTGTSPFWALFVARSGGSWQYSSVGVSSLVLHDGDGLGFRYQSQSSHEPPMIAGDCPDPTPPPTPKPTVRPTAPPTPPPTPTASRPGSSPAPSEAAPASPATPGASPTAAQSDGRIAVATEATVSSPPPPVATDGASAGPDATAAASTQPAGGGPALGLVLVVVAGLAFAALGVVNVRRAR